jgi:hypothetical protein
MGHLVLGERKTFLLKFMGIMAVHLIGCCGGGQITEYVVDGETQDCVKGEMIFDCFDDFCVSLYTSLFRAFTASVSCLNFRLVSSRSGFSLISSSGICS